MTAADVTSRFPHTQAEERVILTASDGETFTSKLSKPETVQASFGEDIGNTALPLSIAISGRTITIHCTGLTDKLVALNVYGKK